MMNKKKNKRIKKKKRVRHQKANIEKKNLDRIQEVKEEDKIKRTNKKAKKAKERIKKKAKSNNEKKSDFYKKVINGEDLLKETLKYEIPKVVVFNVNSMRYDRNSSAVREAYNRLMIDNMKWSKEKIELIKAPSVYPYWYDEYDKQIESFAEENDLDFYNFLDVTQEIVIDYNTDTYDGGLHMNLDGATKLSKYFANILMENYDLTDYSGDELYDEKLEEYNNAIK